MKLAISVATIVAMFTVLGAAAPTPSSGTTHTASSHYTGELPAYRRTVAHPDHIRQYSCTYENIGYWIEQPGGNVIDLYPNVYNCSGKNYVDSVDWEFVSGSGVQLQQWWFYTNCGDWISALSASPYTYLDSSNTQYNGVIGQNVPDANNFDVDTQYGPGEWTACM